MKLGNQIMCNALVLASLLALPAMAADKASGATTLSKDTAQACTKSGERACSPKFKRSVSMRGQGFGRRLKLSDDQLEKMAALKNDFKTSTAPEKAQLKSLSFQLKEEMMKPDVDKAKVMSLEGNINSIRSDLGTKLVSLKLDKLSVLTPEQKQELRHKMLVKEAFGGGFGGARFQPHGERSRASFEKSNKA